MSKMVAMLRRTFLQFPLIGVIASPVAAFARQAATLVGAKGLLVRAGTDRDAKPFKWVDGSTFHVKVSGKDNAGRCVIFDTFRPDKVGPPLHLHTDCDEWFFVSEGEFKFQIGDGSVRLRTGDSLLVRQDTPHAFVKTSEGVARLIVMHQPAASMEDYFRTVITQADQTIDGRRALAEKHGIRLLGNPLSPD